MSDNLEKEVKKREDVVEEQRILLDDLKDDLLQLKEEIEKGANVMEKQKELMKDIKEGRKEASKTKRISTIEEEIYETTKKIKDNDAKINKFELEIEEKLGDKVFNYELETLIPIAEKVKKLSDKTDANFEEFKRYQDTLEEGLKAIQHAKHRDALKAKDDALKRMDKVIESISLPNREKILDLRVKAIDKVAKISEDLMEEIVEEQLHEILKEEMAHDTETALPIVQVKEPLTEQAEPVTGYQGSYDEVERRKGYSYNPTVQSIIGMSAGILAGMLVGSCGQSCPKRVPLTWRRQFLRHHFQAQADCATALFQWFKL